MESKDSVVRRLARDLGMLPRHVERIIITAPLRYKVFEIPKKNGKLREVAQPAREVKAIQRWVVRELAPILPIHDAATAYKPGTSIKANARAHVESCHMLKLDFSDFFPSILRGDVRAHLDRHCFEHFDSQTRVLFAHLFCWVRGRQPPLRLCIGAPSSPFISNSLLFEFDTCLSGIMKERGVTYTRYADDITLTSNCRGQLDGLAGLVAGLLEEISYPRLKLNEDKTVRVSRGDRRVVTGLVITPAGELSIGRDRKRLIRSMFHRNQLGLLDEKQQQKLAGLMSFAEDVEPGFCARLGKES